MQDYLEEMLELQDSIYDLLDQDDGPDDIADV